MLLASWVPYVVFPGITLGAIVVVGWALSTYLQERRTAGPSTHAAQERLRILPAEVIGAVLSIALVVAISVATYHRMR
jgi:hypothetical protein